MEKQIRKIETYIDNYHKEKDIFNIDRVKLLTNLLIVFEDMCRLEMPMRIMNGEDMNIIINSNADSLDMALKWIFECSNNYIQHEKNILVDGGLYIQLRKLMDEAYKYRSICDLYVLWSRKRSEAQLYYNKNVEGVYFKYIINSDVNREVYDLIRSNKKKNTRLDSINIYNISRDLQHIIENSKIDDDKSTIEYEIDHKIWNKAWSNSMNIINEVSELPDDWILGNFKIREFKEYWCVLLTKCMIHMGVCMLSGTKGGAINSCIIDIDKNELEQLVLKHTSLDTNKIKYFIDMTTYRKGVDVIWSPIIPLYSNRIVISPHLIMIGNMERNLISLINKIDQASYSKVSSNKEPVMIEQFMQKIENYGNIVAEYSKPLPDPLPDMDLVLFDKDSKILFIGELKWLLSTDSIQEVYARDEDISKGVKQAKLIKLYCEKNIKDTLNRAYGKNCYEVEKVFTCVITRNNIGTSYLDDSINIIDEDKFFELMKAYKGNLDSVVNYIEKLEFLPELNKDYKIIKKEIDYAGYKFKFDSIKVVNRVRDISNKKTKSQRSNKVRNKRKMSKISKQKNRRKR